MAGNDNFETGTWMEPFSNGLKYNPHTDELFICEHGRRGIGAITKDGKWRQVRAYYSQRPNLVTKVADFQLFLAKQKKYYMYKKAKIASL